MSDQTVLAVVALSCLTILATVFAFCGVDGIVTEIARTILSVVMILFVPYVAYKAVRN